LREKKNLIGLNGDEWDVAVSERLGLSYRWDIVESSSNKPPRQKFYEFLTLLQRRRIFMKVALF